MQDNRFTARAERTETVYDAGLRGHMNQVYTRMALGIAVTALTAWVVGSSPTLLKLLLGGPQMYIVMFAPLAVLWFGFRPDRMKSSQLMMAFVAVSVLYGVSFSVIGLVFTGESIARAFLLATAMFAGLSIYGYTSKRNLDGLGTFAVMGIWGVLFAGILNLFFHSPAMQNVISAVAIIAFSGVTAWQTQTTKEMYNASYGAEINSRMGWMAALNLYISFIALFQHLLHFMGQNRS